MKKKKEKQEPEFSFLYIRMPKGLKKAIQVRCIDQESTLRDEVVRVLEREFIKS
jgi:hypothetical protein